jgi:hypothetical protein
LGSMTMSFGPWMQLLAFMKMIGYLGIGMFDSAAGSA